MNGTVIILNGISSSGKTTLARHLQQEAETDLLTFSRDEFCWMLAKGFPVAEDRVVFERLASTMLPAYNRSIRALSETGNHIICDLIIKSVGGLDDILRCTHGLPAFFIGVHCDIAEVEKREARRPNRAVGNGRSQLAMAHRYRCYDLEVDTTETSPSACALRILQHIDSGQPPSALARLRKIRALERGSAHPEKDIVDTE